MAGDPDDLALALELADIADSITLERFRAADLEVETKPDMTPVTEADTAVEHALRERLATARPEDAVIGEEYGATSAPNSARRWIIDPIDGTKNYVRGIPVWATLIALQEREQTTVGVVSAPALGRRWWGTGGPARTSPMASAPHASCACRPSGSCPTPSCPSPGSTEWEELGRLDALLELGAVAAGAPAASATSGSTCSSPRGRPRSRSSPTVALWDLAALIVIVEEAGGRFTDLGGVATAGGGDAIATNGLLHDAALAIIGR